MSLLDMHNTNKKTQKAQKTITKHKSQNSQKTKHTRKPLQAKHGLCKGFYVKLPPARSEGPRRRTPTHPAAKSVRAIAPRTKSAQCPRHCVHDFPPQKG